MIPEVVFDSAHITNAANGRNLHDNLLSVGDVDALSTVARSVKRVLGFTTATGVWQLLNS